MIDEADANALDASYGWLIEHRRERALRQVAKMRSGTEVSVSPYGTVVTRSPLVKPYRIRGQHPIESPRAALPGAPGLDDAVGRGSDAVALLAWGITWRACLVGASAIVLTSMRESLPAADLRYGLAGLGATGPLLWRRRWLLGRLWRALAAGTVLAGFLTVPTMFFVFLSASARAHLVPWAVCAALVLCVAEPSVFAWARRRRREEIREVVEATLTPRRRRRA